MSTEAVIIEWLKTRRAEVQWRFRGAADLGGVTMCSVTLSTAREDDGVLVDASVKLVFTGDTPRDVVVGALDRAQAILIQHSREAAP